MLSEFIHDKRGSTFTIGYIMDILVMGVLLTGIIIGVTGVLQAQQTQSIRYQSEAISSQVSSRISAIDNVDTERWQTNMTVSLDTPDHIVGHKYTIALVDPPTGEPFVAVNISSSDITETTPLPVDASVVNSSVHGGNVNIVFTDTSGDDPTVKLVNGDQS